MRVVVAAIAAVVTLAAAGASAQNLSLRAPDWAQALLAADVAPTTGGRAVLAAEGIVTAVRVTIAPPRGGVARVIRYEARANGATLALRRFTGHPSSGWWMWGPDAPRVTALAAPVQQELAAMARTLIGAAGAVGAPEEICLAGEQAFIEIAVEERATSLSRACVSGAEPAGRLALRLSELAGSRTEEELAAAAAAELLDADRAFAAMAQSDGVPAAFDRYAAEDTLIVTSGAVLSGRAAVAAHYANWPEGTRLEWAPEMARVSARGDMGWTWGNSVYVAPDGARHPGRYVSIWTRDVEGNWRFSFDAPIR